MDVRILCWDSSFPIAATQNFFPIIDHRVFRGTPVKFVLDSKVPFGACHHQKMIVIDDAVAFCGGADIGPDRWDTPEHLDDDPRRIKAPEEVTFFDSRHEVMSLVDGPAAHALGALFRQRWQRATGETMAEPMPVPPDAWPEFVAPQMRDIEVGISRTAPAWRHEPGVREIERLTLASISAARKTIYMENQYFTSPLVAEALASRLTEPDGPEVVLVSTQHSPSYFDQITMDRTRAQFMQRLRSVDKFCRFHAYAPTTALGRIIIVHAKLAIIDDTLLRVGSANMNNRSTGFDTECDLAFQPEGANRAFVTALRDSADRPLAGLRATGGRGGDRGGRGAGGRGDRGHAQGRAGEAATPADDAAGLRGRADRRLSPGRSGDPAGLGGGRGCVIARCKTTSGGCRTTGARPRRLLTGAAGSTSFGPSGSGMGWRTRSKRHRSTRRRACCAFAARPRTPRRRGRPAPTAGRSCAGRGATPAAS